MSEQEDENERPIVRKMIDEVTQGVTGKIANTEIVKRILQRWPGTNKKTIQATTVMLSVNHDSRVHYPENNKARLANTQSDLLWRVDKGGGFVERYDPTIHGQWEIAEGLEGKCFVRMHGDCAPPFSQIFESKDEARLAFAHFRKVLEEVGCSEGNSGSGLPYWASLSRALNDKLRLNIGLGKITISGYRGLGPSEERLFVLFQKANKPDDIRAIRSEYKVVPDAEPLALGRSGLADVEQSESLLSKAISSALKEAKQIYGGMKLDKSIIPYSATLIKMAFDDALLEECLDRGLPGWTDEGTVRPNPNSGLLSDRCFELLAELTKDPTAKFYQSHKTDFQSEIEKPFEELMKEISKRLPEQMTSTLETSSKIFGKILKNDYGKAGAWPFYWGAFYPKGKKRTEHAQLFFNVNEDHLDYGFYIGTKTNGPLLDQFRKNITTHKETLLKHLAPKLNHPPSLFGIVDEVDADSLIPNIPPISAEEWLGDVKIRPSVRRRIPRAEATSKTLDQFAGELASYFETLFPLLVMVIEDDPEKTLREIYPLDVPVTDPNPEYTLQQIAAETNFPIETLQRWARAIERKGQAVFYGPPGTGKTFVAEKLARHFVGGGNGISEIVQFHPAYAYEDFMQGIRPETRDGHLTYSIQKGRLLRFCEEAERRTGISVLIIDEINRANLSQVFGELMFLLEYRDRSIPLAAGGVFRIPANVRIIGTMNTADRSIALVDHALRRRFAFLQLSPSYDALIAHYKPQNFDAAGLVSVLKKVNDTVNDPNYSVGISYFVGKNPHSDFEDIWEMEIEPYLDELFFDQPAKVDMLRWSIIKQEILG